MAEDQASEAGNAGSTGDAGSDSGSSLRRANAQQARVTRLERLRSSGESSLMGQVVHKVCCVCGCDLSHKARFKDSSGKYWCPRCNDADHERTRPTPCADCGVEMPRNEMVDVRGVMLCPVCNEKRLKTESPVQLRASARMKAASEPTASAPASSIPLLPLIFAVAAVVIAIIVILLVLT